VAHRSRWKLAERGGSYKLRDHESCSESHGPGTRLSLTHFEFSFVKITFCMRDKKRAGTRLLEQAGNEGELD
jgi:hypothetical protein